MNISYIVKHSQYLVLLCGVLGFAGISKPTVATAAPLELTSAGNIPAWLVAGPFELEYLGFGAIADKCLIDEKTVEPSLGRTEVSDLTLSKTAQWQYHAPDQNGYVDLNAAIGWAIPGRQTEKIWWGKAGLAASYIYSTSEQDAFLLTGSNSRLKVFLNGQEIFRHWSERNAVADNDTVVIHLKKGKNWLLITVENSHNNTIPLWFGGIEFGWGFYARLTDRSFQSLKNVDVRIPNAENRLDFDVTPTFFFKKNANGLVQRLDVVITASAISTEAVTFAITVDKKKYSFSLPQIPAGISRHAVYIPEPDRSVTAECILKSGSRKVSKQIRLPKQKHYRVYLNMISHLDIGYTNTQPVVVERQIQALDDVLDYSEKNPDFKWTIEATWCLEQYRNSRSDRQFQKLMDLIKAGRIALSPLYSNPYTGWIGYAEMIRSFDLAKQLATEYGFHYNAAIVNDLPGLSWIMPQVLNQVGANFLVCGLNDFYGKYLIQQNIPKVFFWEGPEKSKVITYLTNAYTEGLNYGLEKDSAGVTMCLWQNLNKLETIGYSYELVYLNSAMSDNGSVPEAQFVAAQKWNQEYEFPKIIISNLAQFATDFTTKYSNVIPTVRGDWTSSWDVLYQGEPELFIKHRAIQHKLVSAEKVTTLNWLLKPSALPEEAALAAAYRSILNFAGHGSGLEYSYGSAEENQWAVANRVGNISLAELQAEEILERSCYRFGEPHFGIEANGLMVFNTLSWERDATVAVQLPHLNQTIYQIVDLTNSQFVPCYQRDNQIIFIARKMPSLGYRKYEFVTATPGNSLPNPDLKSSVNTIENKYYRLTFDPMTGNVLAITDKKTGRKIADDRFNRLLCERQLGQTSTFLTAPAAQVTIKDERPVRLIVEIRRPNFLLENVQYILWSDLDRIDVEFSVDVSRLSATDVIEEYGIAFPFTLDKPEIMVENIGGYLNPERDCFPGKQDTVFSIRRTVALTDRQSTISWAALDSRVIALKKSGQNPQPALYSNFINNFPQFWNRNQISEGHLKTRFALTAREGIFDPGFTSRFGWEIATPAVAMRAPLLRKEPQNGYLSIDRKEVILLSMKSDYKKGELILELLNVDPKNSVTVNVESGLFSGKEAYKANLLGDRLTPMKIENGAFSVKIMPNEILPIIINYGE